ncbi:hypothetical protein [Streptomyces luteogriseus]|uniref:hypothetical protein n=1 Tax=Streptomyces luteogriseus TaxID=68233 RepID=UPI00379A89D4
MPKYTSDVAVLVHKRTGAVISPGSTALDFRGEERKFEYISRLPESGKEGKIIIAAKVGGEVYPSVLDAKIVVLAEAGPRWRVMRDGKLVGEAKQWDGEKKASVLVAPGQSEYKPVIDRQNPTGVSDFLSIELDKGFDATGGYTVKEFDEKGEAEVWAIPAPYVHGTGQKDTDTGIRVVDTWRQP